MPRQPSLHLPTHAIGELSRCGDTLKQPGSGKAGAVLAASLHEQASRSQAARHEPGRELLRRRTRREGGGIRPRHRRIQRLFHSEIDLRPFHAQYLRGCAGCELVQQRPCRTEARNNITSRKSRQISEAVQPQAHTGLQYSARLLTQSRRGHSSQDDLQRPGGQEFEGLPGRNNDPLARCEDSPEHRVGNADLTLRARGLGHGPNESGGELPLPAGPGGGTVGDGQRQTRPGDERVGQESAQGLHHGLETAHLTIRPGRNRREGGTQSTGDSTAHASGDA